MNFFSDYLFFVSGFLLITMCFWSCDKEGGNDDPSSVIISLPLNDTLQYDSGQVILRSVTTCEKVISDLTLEEDCVYAIFKAITYGDWDLEVNLFHSEGIVETFKFGHLITEWIVPLLTARILEKQTRHFLLSLSLKNRQEPWLIILKV